MTTFEDEIINIIINDCNTDEPLEVSEENADKIIEAAAVNNIEKDCMSLELKYRGY